MEKWPGKYIIFHTLNQDSLFDHASGTRTFCRFVLLALSRTHLCVISLSPCHSQPILPFSFWFFYPIYVAITTITYPKKCAFFFWLKGVDLILACFQPWICYSCYEIKNENYYVGLFGAARDSQDTRIGSFRILGGARLCRRLEKKKKISVDYLINIISIFSKIYRLV